MRLSHHHFHSVASLKMKHVVASWKKHSSLTIFVQSCKSEVPLHERKKKDRTESQQSERRSRNTIIRHTITGALAVTKTRLQWLCAVTVQVFSSPECLLKQSSASCPHWQFLTSRLLTPNDFLRMWHSQNVSVPISTLGGTSQLQVPAPKNIFLQWRTPKSFFVKLLFLSVVINPLIPKICPSVVLSLYYLC